MSDYTVDEVLKAAIIASHDLKEHEYDKYDEPVRYFWHDLQDLTLRGEVVSLTEVETTGGEDQGSHASVTFKVGSQFFKKTGYYASHYGYDWDGDFYEVEPQQVTVTKYVRK